MQALVEWFDSPLRLLVPSDSPGLDPYLVELDAYGGNGKCTCIHFTTRIEPYLKRGMEPDTCDSRCKHIKKGREFLTDETIKRLASKDAFEG